ncbi:MAG TPA: biotin/lipoyl-containing protein [Candidatus Limnocylindria bacterium]|jgi:biotin carboxyl carrier protein|nr:biotin/lipoyl-containing protein [Candidatus Limnocylindria bacterium]
MTEPASESLAEVELAAERLIPELTERLRRHGLGEIEVRSGRLRVRVAGRPGERPSLEREPVAGGATRAASGEGAAAADLDAAAASTPVRSPAVGYFVFGERLGPGLDVEQGDALGWIEVLGVRHEVRAPQTGTVRNLVAETGEAVEYGQTLLELEVARL